MTSVSAGHRSVLIHGLSDNVLYLHVFRNEKVEFSALTWTRSLIYSDVPPQSVQGLLEVMDCNLVTVLPFWHKSFLIALR